MCRKVSRCCNHALLVCHGLYLQGTESTTSIESATVNLPSDDHDSAVLSTLMVPGTAVNMVLILIMWKSFLITAGTL